MPEQVLDDHRDPRAPPGRYSVVRPDWLALGREEAIDPGRPIIDAHHHLWDRPGWRYLAEDFAADLATGPNIRAAVLVQARAMYRGAGPEELKPVGETEFAAGVADAARRHGPTSLCAAIVGFADLTLGTRVRPVLEAHLQAGGGRFRGIRQIAAWDGDPEMRRSGNPSTPGLLQDDAFRAGFTQLAPLGLSFDAYVYHSQLCELTELARAFPQTTIVLNHIGAPLGMGEHARGRSEVFARWRTGLRDLASCPNVVAKLGGMGMRVFGFAFEAAPRPPDSRQLAAAWRPYFDTCIECFGAERCMFESNFPVDKGAYGYATFWNACKRLVAATNSVDQHSLFYGTASRIYRCVNTSG